MDIKRVMLVRPQSRCGWGFMWAPLAINLEYIAAYIEKDVEAVTIVNKEFDDTPIEKHISDFQPDFFGVTASATDHDEMIRLTRIAKKRGIPTAVGGYHPTAIPDIIMENPSIDMLFRGEAEHSVKELMDKGTPKDVLGISHRENGKVIHNPLRPLLEDLDSLPFPARHLRAGDECDLWLNRGGAHRDQVHTSRGCWGRCTFCCEPSMNRSSQRYRSPENVFQEIKEVYKYHDEETTLAIFGDPHLMGRAERIGQLSDMLIEADMDISFTAMVRADSIAANPDIVRKMAKAKIIGYCMGVESPNEKDLKGTKKGIDNRIQEKAVHLLRQNNTVAGGTFVIGLPGQTEEEILTFPEYARKLGMINAAFAVATPQAGTEFYDELESQGLIDDRDWTKYDQMHSVFKHDSISKRRFEELLTHCLGRFYAPDVFIDDMIMAQNRNADGRKMSMADVAQFFKARLDFILHSGPQYRPDDGTEFGAIFLRAQVNPYTRKRTELIGLHNMMELKPFLRVFGDQKIQLVATYMGDPIAYYAIKTTKKTVEYVDVSATPHDDATLEVAFELTDLKEKRSTMILNIFKRIAKKGHIPTLMRAALAAFAYHIAMNIPKVQPGPMTLPKQYNTDFFKISGWNASD